MIRMWLEALTRKSSSGRQLRIPNRPGWRRGVSLRLEPLEDRTVTSTFGVDAPGLTGPANVNPPSATSGTASHTAGLDSLISALRDETATPVTASVNLSSSNTFSYYGSGTVAATQTVGRTIAFTADADLSGSVVISLGHNGSTMTTVSISTAATAAEGASKQLAPAQGLTLTVGTANSNPQERVVASGVPDIVSQGGQSPTSHGDLAFVRADRVSAHGLQVTGTHAVATNAGFDSSAALQVRHASRDASHAPPAAEIARAKPDAPSGDGFSLYVAPQGAQASTRGEVQANRFGPDGGAADTGRFVGSMMRPPLEDVPDGVLLQRFAVHREQAAFTALVQRHGRFVLGICQRVLGDTHAAEDVFQATFMILARKASMLDRHSPLAGWLYKVAYHLALRVRAVKARQRQCEWQATAGSERVPEATVANLEQQELRHAVNEELQRLPEKYRVPLVMCYFDGRTHEEAAREMGLPRGSMAKRIGEGLQRLRERLVGRGLVL